MATQVLIVGGFLGAGKTCVLTSLAKHLSSGEGGRPVRLAIIENEIGEISIDDRLVGSGDYVVETIAGGCVCCTLLNSLLGGVKRIIDELAPDFIVLETTGVASPIVIKKDIEGMLRIPVRICCVVDAKRWMKLVKCLVSHLIEVQLTGADLILLNKADLVDAETLVDVGHSVRSFNESADIEVVCANEGLDIRIIEKIVGERWGT